MLNMHQLNLDRIFQSENDVYGHSKILRDYAGIENNFIIPGIVQHGWDFGAGFGYTEDRSELLRKFVWSKANIEKVRLSNSRKYQVIGAPWLYLPASLNDNQNIVEVCRDRTLIFVQHQTSTIKHEMSLFPSLVVDWKSQFGHDSVFCLHPRDYFDEKVFGLFSKNGLRTVTMGSKGLMPHYDASFLSNLKTAISVSKNVVVNQVGTPVLYAANLNKRVIVAGHPTYTESDADKDAREFVENYGDSAEMIEYANFHLGLEYKKSKEELIEIFCWETFLGNRIANGYYLARFFDLLKINKSILKEKSIRLY